jgi:hypothetical protein
MQLDYISPSYVDVWGCTHTSYNKFKGFTRSEICAKNKAKLISIPTVEVDWCLAGCFEVPIPSQGSPGLRSQATLTNLCCQDGRLPICATRRTNILIRLVIFMITSIGASCQRDQKLLQPDLVHFLPPKAVDLKLIR